MRFELLSIPGISNEDFDSKAGTYYCYLYAITPLASTSLLSTVQDALNQTSAFPITGTAINPDLIGISLSTTLTLQHHPDRPANCHCRRRPGRSELHQ